MTDRIIVENEVADLRVTGLSSDSIRIDVSQLAPGELEVVIVSDETVSVTIEDGVKVNTVPVGVQGPKGPPGPDPWQEPIQHIEANGLVEIDYSLGKHVVLTLVGDTQIEVLAWPEANHIARLTVEIHNTGNFGVTAWPVNTKWPLGKSAPATTQGAGAIDVVILTTISAGSVILGYPAGINFS